MKNIFKSLFIVILLSFTSCKNKENVTDSKPEEKPKNQFFSVELDVVNTLEDNYALYYTEDNTINFVSDKAIWSGVKGQPQSQKVLFKLSEEIIPTDFLNFYRPNDSIKTEIDQAKGTIKFLQNPKRYNPIFFYPNEKLLAEISKIYK
jgi:competence protein ComGF